MLTFTQCLNVWAQTLRAVRRPRKRNPTTGFPGAHMEPSVRAFLIEDTPTFSDAHALSDNAYAGTYGYPPPSEIINFFNNGAGRPRSGQGRELVIHARRRARVVRVLVPDPNARIRVYPHPGAPSPTGRRRSVKLFYHPVPKTFLTTLSHDGSG